MTIKVESALDGSEGYIIFNDVVVLSFDETGLIIGAAAASFLELSDTPASYAGQAGKALIVNLSENGLEFGEPPGGVALNEANVWTAGQAGAISPITPSATITLDLTAANNFSLSPSANFTMANPTNITPGQSGFITITQGATAYSISSWGTYWKAEYSTKPVLSGANKKDVLYYQVLSATEILVSAAKEIG